MGGEECGLGHTPWALLRDCAGFASSLSWSPAGRVALVMAICKLGILQSHRLWPCP